MGSAGPPWPQNRPSLPPGYRLRQPDLRNMAANDECRDGAVSVSPATHGWEHSGDKRSPAMLFDAKLSPWTRSGLAPLVLEGSRYTQEMKPFSCRAASQSQSRGQMPHGNRSNGYDRDEMRASGAWTHTAGMPSHASTEEMRDVDSFCARTPAAGKPSHASRADSHSQSQGHMPHGNISNGHDGDEICAEKIQHFHGSGACTPTAGMPSHSCHGEASRPVCRATGCSKPTWNGKPDEYCSKKCRDRRALSSGAVRHGSAAASHEGVGEANCRRAAPTPTCLRSGCTNPTWNGKSEEFCSRRCQHAYVPAAGDLVDAADFTGKLAKPRPIPFTGKGLPSEHPGIVAFYYPGFQTPVDQLCQAMFLGNFYSRRLHVSDSLCSHTEEFSNAEAAFQSLKFWTRRRDFQNISGAHAFRKKQLLRGNEDFSYAGHGSNWAAMRHVLIHKFQDSELCQMLLATGNSILLEHSPSPREGIWSDNCDGTGQNWLGLQLMLLREELRSTDFVWTSWLRKHVNVKTGQFLSRDWLRLVAQASSTVRKSLEEEKDRGQGWLSFFSWGLSDSEWPGLGVATKRRSRSPAPRRLSCGRRKDH
ncbi:unnamed protein product [Effrenium voratum]|uniref:NADAR domain-containing protein n=2 Tax=Effrenium voratum TaxID=2562239 RepID=A0AA36IGE9_9DINO|nr:unnamed protein product [Effrenium voratum]CAJ1446140.1 unnamed protein product [Effrenium voratum]